MTTAHDNVLQQATPRHPGSFVERFQVEVEVDRQRLLKRIMKAIIVAYVARGIGAWHERWKIAGKAH